MADVRVTTAMFFVVTRRSLKTDSLRLFFLGFSFQDVKCLFNGKKNYFHRKYPDTFK